MDILVAIAILKERVELDRKIRGYMVKNDYDKFCERECVAIETVLNKIASLDSSLCCVASSKRLDTCEQEKRGCYGCYYFYTGKEEENGTGL